MTINKQGDVMVRRVNDEDQHFVKATLTPMQFANLIQVCDDNGWSYELTHTSSMIWMLSIEGGKFAHTVKLNLDGTWTAQTLTQI